MSSTAAFVCGLLVGMVGTVGLAAWFAFLVGDDPADGSCPTCGQLPPIDPWQPPPPPPAGEPTVKVPKGFTGRPPR